MSDTQNVLQEQVGANNFTQADETTSRLSQCAAQTSAPTAQTDQLLNKNSETVSSGDMYDKLVLPDVLQGNEENFSSFKKLAAELQLPAETVQKLMDWEASAATAGQKTAESVRADILQKWTEQSKQLFGPAYPQAIARALEAAERFGGPELRDLLDVTGLGSHPAVVKTFHQISQQISEDVSVAGKLRHSTDKTFAEALYGKAE